MDGGGVGGGEGGGGGGREPPTRRLAFHHALHFPDLRARVYFSEENNNVAASQPLSHDCCAKFLPRSLHSVLWSLASEVRSLAKDSFSVSPGSIDTMSVYTFKVKSL